MNIISVKGAYCLSSKVNGVAGLSAWCGGKGGACGGWAVAGPGS